MNAAANPHSTLPLFLFLNLVAQEILPRMTAADFTP